MRACGFLCVICYLLSCAGARAGAWLYPEGKGQLILTSSFADARNAYDASGRLVRTPSYRKFEARAYLEHGLTEWLTFVGEGSAMRFEGAPSAAPLADLDLLIAQAKAGLPITPAPKPGGAQYQGLGLGAAGLRMKLFEYGPYIFSAEASLRGASAQARRFLDMRDPTQVDARLLMGRSFSLFGFPGFLDAQLGYRSRGQNGDEIRFDLTAGVRPVASLMLLAQSFSAVAPRGGAVSRIAAQKFQLSAVYDLTPALSLQLGGVASPGGINAPAERGVISAVWWRY